MLSEWKEVGGTTAKSWSYSCNDGIPEKPVFFIDVGNNDLENKARKGLPDVVERERSDVVIELKTQDFLGVRVDSGVLETPQETHDMT